MTSITDAVRIAIMLVPAAGTLVGAFIAYLVYRVNADRFYLDTFDRRVTAIREVLDAAGRRHNEALRALRIGDTIVPEMPAREAFWLKLDEARPLFDDTVGDALRRLDDALGASASISFEAAQAADYGDRPNDYLNRQTAAASELLAAKHGLARSAAPFITLGARGLRRREAWRRERARLR